MTICVVLCTYNRARQLESVLEQLAAQSVPSHVGWHVLVADNNSNDGTADLVRRFAQRFPTRFQYLHVAQQGKAWALNGAIDVATADVLAFTDDDVDIAPDWLAALARTFEESACMGVGGRILPLFQQGQPSWLRGPLPRELRGPLIEFDLGDQRLPLTRASVGANMAFRREIFQRHGRFRTDLGPNGRGPGVGEDTEFVLRLIEAGEPLVYAPDALVRHPVPPERLHRRYFMHWWFRQGRSSIMIDGLPPGTPTYAGVPPFLVWRVLTSTASALVGRDAKTRLSRLFRASEACGQAVAAVHRAQNGS